VHPFLQSVEPLALALGGSVVSAEQLTNGDIPLTWEGEVVGGFRATGLQGALDRLIDQVERELGCRITELDRSGKQDVVGRLDELGAFTLRKAVEDIADRLEVSRFTVYNYLNAQH
jgi:carbon monoxide dehydrogenase subunit G